MYNRRHLGESVGHIPRYGGDVPLRVAAVRISKVERESRRPPRTETVVADIVGVGVVPVSVARIPVPAYDQLRRHRRSEAHH